MLVVARWLVVTEEKRCTDESQVIFCRHLW
jgi:hypothetical protein